MLKYTFSMQLVGGILPTVHMRTVCVKAEQKNSKQNNRTWFEGYYLPSENTKTFLEEDKLVVCCLCSVYSVLPLSNIDFWHRAGITVGGYWFSKILQCILPSVELV